MSHCKSLVVPYIVFFQEIPLASLFRKKMSAVAILDEICQKKKLTEGRFFVLQNRECISLLGEYTEQVTNVSVIKLKLKQNILAFLLVKNLNDTPFLNQCVQSAKIPWNCSDYHRRGTLTYFFGLLRGKILKV